MPKQPKQSKDMKVKEFLKKQKNEEVESESESENEIVMIKQKKKKPKIVDTDSSDDEPAEPKRRRVDYTEHFMKLNSDLEHIKTELSTFKNFQPSVQPQRQEDKIGELELMRRRMAIKF